MAKLTDTASPTQNRDLNFFFSRLYNLQNPATLSVCVLHVLISMGICMWVDMCGRKWLIQAAFPQSLSAISFSKGSLSEPEAHQAEWTGWPNEFQGLDFHLPGAEVTGTNHCIQPLKDLFLFHVYECFTSMGIHGPHVCTLLSETSKRCWIQNWSYRQLLTVMWVLGSNPLENIYSFNH